MEQHLILALATFCLTAVALTSGQVNNLSSMTHEEYLNSIIQSSSLSATTLKQAMIGNFSWLHLDDFEAPTEVDYTGNGSHRVGPVRDQGLCASGWAIATTGLLEGFEIKNRTHDVIPLSAQNILDCDQHDSGCSGGSVEGALRAIKDEGGLNTEQAYPYEGKNATSRCRYNKYEPFMITMHLKNTTILPAGDEETLMKVVAKYGPVAVALDASPPSFKDYKSGVYFDGTCHEHKPNHHMLVVGYGTTQEGQEYWKLKNSWSDQWGMSGYMLLARNRSNHCGVASRATIVQISN